MGVRWGAAMDKRQWYRWMRKQFRSEDLLRVHRERLKEGLRNPESPPDALTRLWFHGEPLSGTHWTREEELDRWIAASKGSYTAFEGCRQLLDRTGSKEYPIPTELAQWGIDVARGRIQEPPMLQGKRKTDLRWRNARIAQAVEVIRGWGYTLDETCEEVANLITDPPTDPKTEMVLKVYKDTRKDPKKYFANRLFSSF